MDKKEVHISSPYLEREGGSLRSLFFCCIPIVPVRIQ